MKYEPEKIICYAKYRYLDLFLTEAKNRGIKLAAFSDYPIENKILALGLNNIFDLEISSHNLFINKLKPDSKGINFIIKYFNLESKDIIYIGDRYDVDIKTAQNAGVRCIIIRNNIKRKISKNAFVLSYKDLYLLMKYCV